MKLTSVICLTILSGLVVVICCEAFDGIGKWTVHIPQIRVHDAFLPHPHMRDLKAAAKRGKILVITLVVSAGLIVLVSTAVIRSGKEGKKTVAAKTVTPKEMRSRVIAAAAAGRRGLVKGREQALSMALSAYASARDVEWKNGMPEYSPSVTCSIGGDRVTVVIPSDGKVIEVRSICGNIGASAIADARDGSVRSSIFTSHALEREQQ